jgi:group I intron endonuclease
MNIDIPHLDKKFKCSGIYIFKNKITKKVYIGSSININLRIRKHFNTMLRHKKEGRKLIYFYSALNKYKFEDWEFDVLEKIEINNKTKEEIFKVFVEREQYYMDLYQSYNNKKGYNSLKFAYSLRGWKLTDEQKKKISEGNKGKKIFFTEEQRKKLSESHLEYYKTHDGYWKGKKRNPKTVENMKKARSNPILQIDKVGNIIKRWNSAREADRESNGYFNHAKIGECCSKKRKTHRKYYWIKECDYINLKKEVINL